jgi:hypothetical protein
MPIMKEGMFVPNDALLILLVPPVDALQDLLLHLGRVDVLGDRPDDLRQQYSTLIA